MERRKRINRVTLAALTALFAAMVFLAPTAHAQTSTTAVLDALYKEGRIAYERGDYQKAITLFETIKGQNPQFNSQGVANYLKSSRLKLGAPETREAYDAKEIGIKKIEIRKEGELELLSREAEKILLDVNNFYEQTRREKKISDFRLLDVQSSLKMAKDAYEKKEYPETIRLANKARFQLDELLATQTREAQPLLGEIGRKTVTLNLTNADLEQSLKLIYDLTGANIVVSKGVTGRVTINVQNLPLQQALNLICEANNLNYIEEDNIIKIMSADEYQKRPEVQKAQNRRVFPILYGDANSITKALKETFKLDSIVYEPRTNSILIDVDNPALAKQIEDVVSSLDTPVSQVLLEAKIITVSSSLSNTFGIDWLVSSRLITALNSGGTTLTGPRFGNNLTFTPGTSSSLPAGGFAFGLTNADVSSLIQALTVKGDVKLVQAPKIMCLNGTNAVIRVVQNYPYIIPQYSETYDDQGRRTGTNQSVELFEETVGTEFIVTPIIQRNRTVFLNLSIMDSQFVQLQRMVAIAANLRYEVEQPIIAMRETQQSVTLSDGQSLIIGGMIQNRKEKNSTGVPFLSRIPILGYLFKKPTLTETNSELLIFLTPHVITTFQEADDISRPEVKKADKKIDAGLMEKF